MGHGKMKQHTYQWVIILFILIIGPLAVAEDFVESLSGEVVENMNADADGAGREANRIALGMTGDPNRVLDTTLTNSSLGREQKAQDGQMTANVGKGMAIGTGVALMAEAIPKLASPFAWDRAVGAALMAKSSLEFAQAGVNAGAARANDAQEKLLRAEANQSVEGIEAAKQAGQKEVTDKVTEMVASNPELAKVLSQNGVNQEDFAKRFAAGEFSSPEAVLAATGTGAGIDSKMLADSSSNANLSPEDKGRISTATAIQLDEERKEPSSEKGGESSLGNAEFSRSQDSSASTTASAPDVAHKKSEVDQLLAVLSGGGAKGVMEAIRNASEGDLTQMLAGLFGGPKEEKANASTMGEIQRQELQKKGIVATKGKVHIFHLAHKNYRSFKKWRQKMDVVAIR